MLQPILFLLATLAPLSTSLPIPQAEDYRNGLQNVQEFEEVFSKEPGTFAKGMYLFVSLLCIGPVENGLSFGNDLITEPAETIDAISDQNSECFGKDTVRCTENQIPAPNLRGANEPNPVEADAITVPKVIETETPSAV